jgi:predicted ferric reductase
LRLGRFTLRTPSVGTIILVLAHLILVTVLCLYDLDLNYFLNFQYVGYRTGFVSMAQLPLIFLLAGKNNLIGCVTGMSYERLNWLHRWVSRSLLLTTTLHMAYWFRSWAPYGGYIGEMVTTDTTTKHGVIAWGILAWIVFSSFAPIRGWSYEIFVLQHVLSMIALIVAIYLHTPPSCHGWIWAPVAIYAFDRLARAFFAVYTNLSIFHPKQQGAAEKTSKLWSCQAVMTALPDNNTRVIIANPPISWQPGQHVFLSCQSIAPLQNHPFTIASLPSDGKLEFLVKAHRGGTKRMFAHATKAHLSLPSIHDPVPAGGKTVSVSIDGPYGRMRPLRQFDSVILFAGSTGATFTVPHLRDIVRQWRNQDATSTSGFLTTPDVAATRHIRFVWVVKSRAQICWFAEQLNQAIEDVQTLRAQGRDVELEISVYVTCDGSLTEDWNTSAFHPASAKDVEKAQLEETDAPLYTTSSEDTDSSLINKKKATAGDVAVREIDPRHDSTASSLNGNVQEKKAETCGGEDGTCCCQTTITDEAAVDAIMPTSAICHCNCSHNSASSSTSSSSNSIAEAKKHDARLLHQSIHLLAGRPHPRSIITKSLEQATGESAVVVCGPKGLNDDVRRTVVSVSDERAVSKGSGALGVWFWGEGFGW